MTTLTISPPVSFAPGIEPVVATVSSVRTKPSQTFSCSVSVKPTVPTASSPRITNPSVRRRRRMASVVVGLTGEDLVGAEELLEQHHPRELMRQGHRSQREPVIRAGVAAAVAERSADHEAQVARLDPAFVEEAAEGHRVHRVALGVEHRDKRPLRDAAEDLLVLADLDDLDLRMACEQPLIVLHVVGIGRAEAAYRHDDDLHDPR